MRAGIHEHLMFGEGEIDFPPVIAALAATGYTGGLHVELSRHSHAAVDAARRAFAFLAPLVEATGAEVGSKAVDSPRCSAGAARKRLLVNEAVEIGGLKA